MPYIAIRLLYWVALEGLTVQTRARVAAFMSSRWKGDICKALEEFEHGVLVQEHGVRRGLLLMRSEQGVVELSALTTEGTEEEQASMATDLVQEALNGHNGPVKIKAARERRLRGLLDTWGYVCREEGEDVLLECGSST